MQGVHPGGLEVVVVAVVIVVGWLGHVISITNTGIFFVIHITLNITWIQGLWV
jgi:hypothetical protein